MIEQLNLPKAHLKLTRKNDQVFVWCVIRNKNLVCTPEEWVRQHVIHFLLNEKKISKGLIASEVELKYNGLSKRADVVVFDSAGKAELLIECKATSVPITEKVLHQAAQYNFQLGVDTLLLTNGLDHVCCKIDRSNGKLEFINDWIEKA